MSIRVERYSNEHEDEWDKFIELKAKNATFLHSRRFYNHNEANKSDDCSLLFYKNNSLIALFPANLYNNKEHKILHSYLRATYGGIVIGDINTPDIISIVELITQFANDERINEIIIRPCFSIYHTGLSDSVDYALWKCGYKIKSRELEYAIDLQFNPTDNYNDSTNRNIKKSIKQGVIVKEDENLSAYWKILEDNLQGKHGTKPVHTYEEICKLISLVNTGRIKLFTAQLNNQIIGGILTFLANKRVIHAQYIASDNTFQEYRPLNAVIDFIAKWAKEKGYIYFNLGMATEPGGLELNEGLVRFKEGFGAKGVLRETMYLTL